MEEGMTLDAILDWQERQHATRYVPVTTILDMRVPQPGRYAEYFVPDAIARAADLLLAARNTCSDAEVDLIDRALLRLLRPWVHPEGNLG